MMKWLVVSDVEYMAYLQSAIQFNQNYLELEVPDSQMQQSYVRHDPTKCRI